MNTEQERAFIEWRTNHDPRKYPAERDAFMAGWDAGRAALQSQDREDAERIQFMADEACTFNTWKQEDGSWKYRLEWDHGTEWQTEWFSIPEEAIDHARRIEGEGE